MLSSLLFLQQNKGDNVQTTCELKKQEITLFVGGNRKTVINRKPKQKIHKHTQSQDKNVLILLITPQQCAATHNHNHTTVNKICNQNKQTPPFYTFKLPDNIQEHGAVGRDMCSTANIRACGIRWGTSAVPCATGMGAESRGEGCQGVAVG